MKILIILGSLLLREALKDFLAREIKGCIAVTGEDFRDVEEILPDAILVDVHKLKLIPESLHSEIKLVLLDTGLEIDQIISNLIKFRLHGVIDTHTDVAMFKNALQSVLAGRVWIHHDCLRCINRHIDAQTTSSHCFYRIKKEHEIIELIALGMKNKEIAKQLFISDQTVKFHLRKIFRKYGVTRRSQLASIAMEFKLRALSKQH
jgi:DNA-binding NarL/FixJ family response regulator